MFIMREFIEMLLLASRDVVLLVIIIYLILLLIGKYIPAAWRHGIWLLVAVRLLMPALPESEVSWQVLVDEKEVLQIDHDDFTAFDSSPIIDRPKQISAESFAEVEGLVSSIPNEEVSIAEFSVPEDLDLETGLMENIRGSEMNELQVTVERKGSNWLEVMFYVWLVGACVLSGIIVSLAIRFSRKLKGSAVSEGQQVELEKMVQHIAKVNGWRHVPEIRITDAVDVPAFYGMIKPKVLIPPSVLSSLGESELNLALLHELGHWRRKDLWVNFMLAILQVIYWFNPFVWLAFHRVKVESERATDVWVLKRCGADHSISYGEMLFSLLKDKSSRGNLGSGIVSVIESPRDLKRRMKGIVSFKGKSSVLSMVCSLVVMLVIAAACLTQAPASDQAIVGEDEEVQLGEEGELNKVFEVRVLSSTGKPVENTEVYYRVYTFNKYSKLESGAILAGRTNENGKCKVSLDLKKVFN